MTSRRMDDSLDIARIEAEIKELLKVVMKDPVAELQEKLAQVKDEFTPLGKQLAALKQSHDANQNALIKLIKGCDTDSRQATYQWLEGVMTSMAQQCTALQHLQSSSDDQKSILAMLDQRQQVQGSALTQYLTSIEAEIKELLKVVMKDPVAELQEKLAQVKDEFTPLGKQLAALKQSHDANQNALIKLIKGCDTDSRQATYQWLEGVMTSMAQQCTALQHLQSSSDDQKSILAMLDQRQQVQGSALTQYLTTQLEQTRRTLRRWLMVTICLSALSLTGVAAMFTQLMLKSH